MISNKQTLIGNRLSKPSLTLTSSSKCDPHRADVEPLFVWSKIISVSFCLMWVFYFWTWTLERWYHRIRSRPSGPRRQRPRSLLFLLRLSHFLRVWYPHRSRRSRLQHQYWRNRSYRSHSSRWREHRNQPVPEKRVNISNLLPNFWLNPVTLHRVYF